jgi:hypothetical protein
MDQLRRAYQEASRSGRDSVRAQFDLIESLAVLPSKVVRRMMKLAAEMAITPKRASGRRSARSARI